MVYLEMLIHRGFITVNSPPYTGVLPYGKKGNYFGRIDW